MKNKKILIISALFIAVSIIIMFCILKSASYSIDDKNKTLLRKYGWINTKGGILTEYNAGVLIDINDELDELKFKVSEEIGLNPRVYITEAKNFKVYNYDLGKNGNTQPLYATFWIYDQKIVCAYIYHTEPKIIIHYWSLKTPYSEIVDYIEKQISLLDKK